MPGIPGEKADFRAGVGKVPNEPEISCDVRMEGQDQRKLEKMFRGRRSHLWGPKGALNGHIGDSLSIIHKNDGNKF